MTEIIFWIAVIPIVLFPLLYAILAPWWRTELGRHEMTLSVALFLLALNGILIRLFGPNYPGIEAIRVFNLSVACLAVWWRLIIFLKIQVQVRTSTEEKQR